MGNWLFGAQGNRITSQDRAILDLKAQRDQLKKYSIRVMGNIEKEMNYVKTILKQTSAKQDDASRNKARLALRRKKYQEKLLDQAEKTLLQVEELIGSIEFAQVERQVFEGLKRGNTVLSDLNERIGGVEGVERILDDVQDSIDTQNEIDVLISGTLTTEDDGSIIKELETLIAAETTATTEIIAGAPKVPVEEPISEQREIKKLERNALHS